MHQSAEKFSEARALSEAARGRLLSHRGEPLFIAAWERVVMIHFEMNAGEIQKCVPFELDLWEERAFVSLVAFTMRGMRPRVGGKLLGRLLRPIAAHEFLNVRTYVRQGGEAGIYFLAEWLSNSLAVRLGPRTFGLPYRHGRVRYEHDSPGEVLRGRIEDKNTGAVLVYNATPVQGSTFEASEPGSLTAWLLERYTAFTCRGNKRRFFRVWHPPWRRRVVAAELTSDTLLTENWPWFGGAQPVSANYSPGFDEVWMGRPHGAKNVRRENLITPRWT